MTNGMMRDDVVGISRRTFVVNVVTLVSLSPRQHKMRGKSESSDGMWEISTPRPNARLKRQATPPPYAGDVVSPDTAAATEPYASAPCARSVAGAPRTASSTNRAV